MFKEIRTKPIYRMSETVYCLSDCGNSIITHWFLFVMSALKHISVDSQEPIKIHTNVTEQFQREALELLKPRYEFVECLQGLKQVTVPPVNLINPIAIEPHYYPFVRNLFLEKHPELVNSNPPTRYIYISRNKSHLLNCNSGVARRQLLNDAEVQSALSTIGFECVFLEDFSLVEKIKLYQEAKVIVTPSGGANTMAFFANPKTKIIEIIDSRSDENQYWMIGQNLGNHFIRYTNIQSVDGNKNPTSPALCKPYNMILPDCNHLITFLKPYMSE
jgi:capsular polysaccharide biosynthesis protein